MRRLPVSVPHCVHWEARAWPRSIHFYPVKFMVMWCDRHGLDSLKQQVSARNIDGDKFLGNYYHSGRMQEELKLSIEETIKVKEALENRHGAVLNK